MYSTLPYFAARVLVDLPLKIVCPVILGSISYWSVGLQADGEKFAVCLLTLVLLALSGNSIGLFLGCLFEDVSIALLVAPMVILPLMMFSGFFLNPESTPVYLQWIEWISPMKYSFAALALNEFSGLKLHCEPDQLRTISSNGTGAPAVQICPISSGEAYLDNLNIQSFLTIANCQLLLFAMAVAFTVLAYIALELTSRAARKKTKANVAAPASSATTTKKVISPTL